MNIPRWSDAEEFHPRSGGLGGLPGSVAGSYEALLSGASREGGGGILVHLVPSGGDSGSLLTKAEESGSLFGFIGVSEQRGCPSPRAAEGKSPEKCVEAEGRVPPASVGKRSRRNCVKSKKVAYNYVLGEDIGWERVLQMADHTLVGRAMGRHFALKMVVEWARENWKEHVGYVPEVVMLTRGWCTFHFLKPEHGEWVMNRSWALDHTPLLLKHWHPLFDVSRERVDIVQLWVKLHGLPLHYWKEEHLREIGNILGSFIEVDMSFEKTKHQQVARILVNINIREGLAEELNLCWGPTVIKQILDYENVPFRCRRCHVYGHPTSDCNLPLRTRLGRRPPKQAGGKDSAEEDVSNL